MLNFSVTFIITIINVTILFLILRKILFKPVTKIMADRTSRVQDTIQQADISKAQADKLLEQYEARMKKSEAEAAELINSAREEAKTEAERIVAEGKADVQAMIAAAHKRIELEQKAALAGFRAEAVALVMAASARLLQRELSGEDNSRYLDMLLDELAARKRNN